MCDIHVCTPHLVHPWCFKLLLLVRAPTPGLRMGEGCLPSGAGVCGEPARTPGRTRSLVFRELCDARPWLLCGGVGWLQNQFIAQVSVALRDALGQRTDINAMYLPTAEWTRAPEGSGLRGRHPCALADSAGIHFRTGTANLAHIQQVRGKGNSLLCCRRALGAADARREVCSGAWVLWALWALWYIWMFVMLS